MQSAYLLLNRFFKFQAFEGALDDHITTGYFWEKDTEKT